MALSRRDVILTCAVAFVGWASVMLWIPQLLFVPSAFVTGVLASLVGVACLILASSRGRQHETLPHLPPTSYLSLTASEQNWRAETGWFKNRLSYHTVKVQRKYPLVSRRIDELLGLALRDFIKTWFSKISGANGFTNEVDRALRASLETVLERFHQVDLVRFGVTKLLPILNTHVRDFHAAERLVRGRMLNSDVTETAELDMAIAGRYLDGKLHPAASLTTSKTTASQQQHLRRIAGRLVAQVLPANMTSSSSVLVLIREIVACGVFFPIMVLLADPDILNQMIEAYGRSIWQERKTVRKLRKALDEASSSNIRPSKPVSFPKLDPEDSERSFEKFVRAIRQSNSLLDARRFRSEVSRQLKRDKQKSRGDATYLRRLEIGRKLLDQKVSQLSASQVGQPENRQRISLEEDRGNTASWKDKASLRQVLYDAYGLSYFMEYMDRQNGMSLVQFWIVVDGLRNPLDVDNDNEGESNNYSSAWNQSDRQDILQINTDYLSRPEFNITQVSKDAIESFLGAGDNATQQQYDRAKNVVLDVQASVFQQLKERHFSGFRKSDLFFKWLASDASQNINARPEILEDSLDGSEAGSSLRDTKLNESNLRRAIASSSDLAGSVKNMNDSFVERRSLDDSSARPLLFGDDPDDDPLSKSKASLNSQDESNGDRTSMISAVQAALDDLVDEDGEEDSLTHSRSSLFASESPGEAVVESITPPVLPPVAGEKGKPSLASLGLLGTPSKPTVFSQGDLFGEQEKLWQDEDDDETNGNAEEDDIHEAAPGDLGLSELVQNMTLEIEKLEAQQAVVDSLMRKAELTNNAAELRILRKSKTSLEREIHRKELQRQQYIIQSSENDLYRKASIAIKSIMVGNDSDGHEFALYVIEVQRNSGEKGPGVGWAIARRYSEFHELHKQLRSKFPELKDLDFPRRQMVVTLQRDFLKKRRVALEKYLRELLARPMVCRSREFRAFLSQQAIRSISDSDGRQVDRQDFITRIYNSVTDGMEEFLGNTPVIDQLSAAGQNLITAATAVSTSGQPGIVAPPTGAVSRNPAEAAAAEAELAAFEGTHNRDSNTATSATTSGETVTFIKPICDAFAELFQLNQGNNWLRGRAIVVVIQQLLGGTIERHVRDAFKSLTSQESLVRYLDLLKDTMWPGGVLRSSPSARTEAEKAKSRREASLVLATLLPDLAGSVVGKSNSAKAGRRIFATLNNERLNVHLVYTLLDEIVDGIFGVRVGK